MILVYSSHVRINEINVKSFEPWKSNTVHKCAILLHASSTDLIKVKTLLFEAGLKNITHIIPCPIPITLLAPLYFAWQHYLQKVYCYQYAFASLHLLASFHEKSHLQF